jgi:hypothetical protein
MTMSLQEISDRLEIQDLLVAYSYALDFQDWDAMEALFTTDAMVDYTAMGGSKGDLATTMEYLRTTMPMFSSYQHLVAGSEIKLDGDTAHVRTMLHNPMLLGEGEHPDLMLCGVWYLDTVVRMPGGWKFKERVEKKSYMRIFPGQR